MNELKTEETIEKIIDMISDFGDGILEFETTDINCLINQLTIQENYNDMLVRECDELKAKIEVCAKALLDIQNYQMNYVRLARTTSLYKIAGEALIKLGKNEA